MSPSGDAVPRTPDRRSSSSALFGAFSRLTGRIGSPTPPPSITSTSDPSSRTPSLKPHYRPESVASPMAVNVDGNISNTVRRSMSGRGGDVVGGPPELAGLVDQMHRSQPLSDRVVAVRKVCEILAIYPVRNVLGIWNTAGDLIAPDQDDDAVSVGFLLLRTCAALSELSRVERRIFFQAASSREGDKHFESSLRVVSVLTDAGRNVEAVEALIPTFVQKSIDACFKGVKDSRKARGTKGKHTAETSPQEVFLTSIFEYTSTLCKFNSKVFREEELEKLLDLLTMICNNTTQASDMEKSVKLLDVVITYHHIPARTLQPCLETLCAIHRQIDDLQEQAWTTLSNLFRSHIGHAAVAALLHVLLDGPHSQQRSNRQYSTYRGVMQVLQILLLEDGRAGLPKVPISSLFPALKATIKRERKSHEDIVLELIAALLAEEKLRQLLLEEVDWSDLIYIIRTCSEREDDRDAAHAASTDKEKTVIEKTFSSTGLASLTSPSSEKLDRMSLGKSQDSANGIALSVTSTVGDDADIVSNTDSSVVPSRQTDTMRRNSDHSLSRILITLDSMTTDMDFVQKAATMELFMQIVNRLTDSTAESMITYYAEERYLHPSSAEWLDSCRSLASGVLQDRTRPRSLRVLGIHMLRETHSTVEQLCATDTVSQCAALLLDNIETEDDVEVLTELVDFAVEVADRASDEDFPKMLALLKRRLDRERSPAQDAISTGAPFLTNKVDQVGSPSNVIATAFVRLFTRSITNSAQKTLLLYDTLRDLIASDDLPPDSRLAALKLLFRLRADSNHALVVNSSSEGESIAAVLCRTAGTAVASEKGDDAASTDGSKPDDLVSWREQRKHPGNSPHSSLNRHTSRSNHPPSRITKPVPPLWMYPGPKGLPEEPSPKSSRVAFAHIDAEQYPLSDDILDMQITLWLELIISLLQKASDWEIYSYIVVHLGPQLSNQALVRSCVPQLKMLRGVICEQLRGSTFREPPSYTLVKKSDVAVCLYHILTMLISYHDHYEKSEEDDMVKVFLHGIGYWDRTSKWCIHALSVSCQETPLSVSKSLDSIIQKMSQIITKPSTAIHILEFLISLARMPELYKNFRDDEFKTVFGVSFRYLQHVRDQRERSSVSNVSHTGHRSLRHTGPSRDFAASPDQSTPRKSAAADDLPQYLYSLAYHVITFWFMGLKMEDRPKFIPWITKSLQYTDNTGRSIMEEQGQVIVDMMSMVGYSDRDETVHDPNFAKPGDGEVWKKTWILGQSLVTIETAARTGASMITTRRPCGTRYIYARPQLSSPPRHQVPITVGLASEAFYMSSYVGVLPDDIFQTFYAPLNLLETPVALPDDDTSRRAISTFDRNATVDGHKVGVVYIGEGQTNEKEILMNDIGSAAYTSFLNDLGTLVRLKDAKFNTGGLDTRDNADGEFTYCWRDRCIELVFHIPTMMPTNPDDDMTYPNKKRHIGNDFVNIIFNDSGLPYNFDTFPSAFNYVHIVITPESRVSFVDRRLDSDPDGKNRYYKVQVISRPGFPDISPAVEPKILCGKHLANYCRLVAINASVFAQVWYIREGGESISSWRNRLREIKRLRERYGALDISVPAATASPSSPVNQQTTRLSSPPSRNDSTTGFNRTSIATFVSEGTNRSSMTSSTHDVSLSGVPGA